MKNKNILIAGIVVVLIAGVGFAIASGSDKNSTSGDQMTHETTPQDATKTPDTSKPAATADTANAITIENYKYGPPTMTVKVGTKVTWTNKDTVKHTVTADSGDGPNSSLFGKGESYSYTFAKAGTFSYHCTPHPYMKATVTVTE